MKIDKMNPLQVVSIAIIVLLIANLVFFAFKRTNTIYFWIFLALAAIYAFIIMPKFMKFDAIIKDKGKERKEDSDNKEGRAGP